VTLDGMRDQKLRCEEKGREEGCEEENGKEKITV
jgi:hypothetical protein